MDVEGLEDVIVKRARSYATAMAEAVSRSHTEEDIRIESERQLALIEQHANITLDGRHEFTVASGRADSVYDRVVIEYKNPHSRADQIGSEIGSGGTKKVVAQIKDRLGDLVADYGQPVNSLLGVGLDGRRIVFVRFRERQWQVQHPVELNHRSAERFIRALFNLGTRGKPFTPDYLSSDFGAESSMAQDGIRALYESITTTSDARAHTLFDQWRIMFSEVCGYDVDDRSNKMLCLAKSYEIDQNDLRPAELLFALHTYYAIFMKLLAAEIVAFFHELPSPLQKLIKATTSAKLKRELKDLESGGIFRHLNITNFLEGDLFAWYVSAWSVKVEDLVRKMTAALDDYNPGTLSEDPLQSRDLLKKLYHHLFPRSVRHDLGEYYTPDWLADHVLEELGYEGDPRLRLLDPACGSGTFLVMAINRIRRWHDENREDCGLSEGDICDALLKNVVGFDLNPLAVMAARTNYLIAIRDLLRYVDRVEIPIYLCDSVATPAEYGDLFSGAGSVARVPCSAVRPRYLFVPKEIAATSEHVATYARLLEHGVRVGSSGDEFVRLCVDEGLPIGERERHVELINQLIKLERANKNGLWARIIKNAFAPLFAGRFDFVAGNPPWVNWEHLPSDYRTLSARIWDDYRLVGQVPGKRRQQADKSKTDVSILMTYVSCDKLLNDGGALGFVITRSVFQSELGGWHFREFSLPGGVPIRVDRVFDFDAVKPFRGQAANLTCTFFVLKGRQTEYPVDWVSCVAKQTVSEDDDYDVAMSKIEKRSWIATPIDRNQLKSPWLFGDAEAVYCVGKYIGRSPYSSFAREGVNTRGANGVYFAHARMLRHRLFVKNLRSEGVDQAIPEVEQSIEADFVYPLLRGRDVQRWVAEPSGFIVMPHDAVRPSVPLPLSSLPLKTQEYLTNFREKLERRKKFRNFDPTGEHWHGLYSVLEATFAPYKVVWREMATGTLAAVVTETKLPNDVEKVTIPDHKLFLIPCTSMEEALFVCGFFNSSIADYIVRSYALSTGISAHVLERIPIPEYTVGNPSHQAVATAARACWHSATLSRADEDAGATLDRAVGDCLGLSATETSILRSALAELH